MKIGNLLICTCFVLFNLFCVNAQVSPISPAEVEAQLKAKGITNEEFLKFLESKSITEEDLKSLQPEEILELEKDLDAYIKAKTEKEKAINAPTEVKSDPEPVKVTAGKIVDKESPTPPVLETQEPKIEIYGRSIFRNGNIAFYDKAKDVQIPGSYILGVGDQIAISIFGSSQIEDNFVIAEDGYIRYASGQRRIYLRGLSLNEAREKITKVFSNIYVFSPGEINVAVNSSRTINVNIYGEVNKPGGYLIPAINSPLNALMAAEGPDEKGSLRNIKVIKSSGETFEIDVYKFLSDPSINSAVSLENNDIIHVPIAQKVVQLKGAVKKPMKYEMKMQESLQDLVVFSGGFKDNAFLSSIQIQRYENGIQRVIDVNMTLASGQKTLVQDGDIITVRAIDLPVRNVVSVSGQVNNPGEYELVEGMRLKNLVEKSMLNELTRRDLALIQRQNPDGTSSLIKINLDEVLEGQENQNIELQSGDKLLVWAKSRFTDRTVVSIDGAVREPSRYPYDDLSGVKVSDLIKYAGGLRRDASEVSMVFRMDPMNPNKIEYIRINTEQAIQNNPIHDILLMAYDSISIYTKEEVSLPYSVEISGEVNDPGFYQYGEQMTIKDLVILAKGFSLSAKTNRIEVNRLEISNNTPTQVVIATIDVDRALNSLVDTEIADYVLQPFDKVIVRAVPDFEFQKVIFLEGEVKYPGKYVLQAEERIADIINRAGGLNREAYEGGAKLFRETDNVGYIIIDLPKIMKSQTEASNFLLKDKDRIIIPKMIDFVELDTRNLANNDLISFGNSDNINIAFEKNKRANYYINEYGGGFAKEAERKSLYVVQANGIISKTDNFLFFRIYPKVDKGGTIYIPSKPIRDKNEDGEKDENVDWTKLLTNSVSQAMSVLTLILLIQRLDG